MKYNLNNQNYTFNKNVNIVKGIIRCFNLSQSGEIYLILFGNVQEMKYFLMFYIFLEIHLNLIFISSNTKVNCELTSKFV